MKLRIAAYEPRSVANGPGVRAVLWVQGCGRRCPGCFNPEFQPREGGREVAVEEVLGWIAAAEGIEGVTFSGGEPFDQAEALAEIARGAQGRGLGVAVFTGYAWEEVESGKLKVESGEGGTEGGGQNVRVKWKALVATSDLIVAGPYEEGRPGKHPLLASANQELVFVTERYRKAVAGLRRRVEFHIGGDEVRVTGFPPGEWKVGSRKGKAESGKQ